VDLVIILDRIKGTAKDLTDPRIGGLPIRLRLEGDSDDPATWHPVKVCSSNAFREDTSQPFVRARTVSFHDGTSDVMFNETDEVEFAVPRPIRHDAEIFELVARLGDSYQSIVLLDVYLDGALLAAMHKSVEADLLAWWEQRGEKEGVIAQLSKTAEAATLLPNQSAYQSTLAGVGKSVLIELFHRHPRLAKIDYPPTVR
jgi:hypothetical protein